MKKFIAKFALAAALVGFAPAAVAPQSASAYVNPQSYITGGFWGTGSIFPGWASILSNANGYIAQKTAPTFALPALSGMSFRFPSVMAYQRTSFRPFTSYWG